MSIVLVTGGAGFIGSHVVRAMLAGGHRVVVVDDLSSGRRELVPPHVEFHQMSILDSGVDALIEKVKPDVVDHHAAQISVNRSVREPQLDATINVVGTVNMLEACANHGVKRFIFASTGGALYGEPEYMPCREDHPIAPLSPYGTAKYCVEQYVRYYSRARGVPSVVLRYSNVYGPNQDPHGEAGVVAIFSKRMLADRQPVIYGTGDQARDFVYAGDVAEANRLALEKGEGGMFNIGTGELHSVNELYRVLAEETGYKHPPAYEAPRPGEVFKITLDYARAQRELGWRPTTSFREGLRRTVEAFAAEGKR